ncbi:MAG: hypothetical protein MUF48_22360, partial [Pirellulaceae bacterium]|nr:hypothetical protein [Pirellulaceae bacterium]
MVLNPLHDQLYVLSPGEPVLAVFDRNSSEGTLALRQKLAVAADANGLTVSPDGDAVYVSSPTGFGIWTRQTDGLLIERVGPHGDAGDWIIRAAGSSGTGTLLFLTSDSGDTVQVLVDSGTAISHLQDITGIVDPSAVALSPDGQHLFVTSAADHALHVLVKQADESYLPLQTFREGEAGLRGMKG